MSFATLCPPYFMYVTQERHIGRLAYYRYYAYRRPGVSWDGYDDTSTSWEGDYYWSGDRDR